MIQDELRKAYGDRVRLEMDPVLCIAKGAAIMTAMPPEMVSMDVPHPERDGHESKGSPDPKGSLKIFLCHSSGDKATVRELYNRLRGEKAIDPWLDAENILPGADWDLEIREAVRSAHVVLVCLSKGSVSKEGYIQKEISQALDVALEKPEGTIFIIPLRLEECDVPSRLKKWQWLDFFEEGSYGRLISALKKRASDLGISVD
jgi:hypothetical protein